MRGRGGWCVGQDGGTGAVGSDPGLHLGVPLPGAAAEPTLLVPPPLHPLVHGPGVGLEAHKEAEVPSQAAVNGHGHHNEWGHDDEAEDDEGGGTVVVQDGFAVVGVGVQHLPEKGERAKHVRSWQGKAARLESE